MNDRRHDYIIVGSGAGGSAAAYRLAQTGRSVLVIEKGPALPEDGSTLDPEKVLRQGAFKNHEPWVDGRGKTVYPEEYFNLGGKTKWYGAALLRLSPHEFGDDPRHQCRAWPIGYEDLAPFYDEAERLLGVRNFPVEPNLRAIFSRLAGKDAGWHEHAMPIGLVSDILEHPAAASHFDGYAVPHRLKSDAEAAMLAKVEDRPNLRVVTGSAVAALVGAAGNPRLITGVRLADGTEYGARRVLLAAGAMHSPRLLQAYVEDQGLAAELPSYRPIGRNFKTHLNTILVAFGASRRTDVLCKTALLMHDDCPHSILQALGGGIVGDLVVTQAPGFAPRFLSAAMGRHAYGFFLTTEDGSHPDNRVAARADGTDRPLVDYDPTRIRPAFDEHRRFVATFRRGLLGVGLVSVARLMPIEATAHACGTLVTGKDPDDSVVDAGGKVHGMEGLYVVDGSVLPRSSRVNPALTIYAWGLRVGAALAAQGLPDEEPVA
jgi:choline dehydrogenase-like flavoprotein